MDQTVINGFKVKIPSGHMWLKFKFTVLYSDDNFEQIQNESSSVPSSLDELSSIGISPELSNFLESCVGKVDIDKKDFSLLFSDNQDYARFLLINLPTKPMS